MGGAAAPPNSMVDPPLDTGSRHLQIDNPAAGSVEDRTVPLLDKAQLISQAESSNAISMTVPVSLEPKNPHQPILKPFPKERLTSRHGRFAPNGMKNTNGFITKKARIKCFGTTA